MTTTTITLTWTEMMIAAHVGIMRQVQNLRLGRQDRFGANPENGWTPHIEGACGEMAVAKFLGRYWSGAIGDLRAADVGNLQVRTRSKMHYDLLLHPSDADDKAFVLALGVAPTFEIAGWIIGRDGKKQEYWNDPVGGRPAFFVPQAVLSSPMTLV